MKKIFLTAQWRKLIMANYAVDPAVFKKYLPYQTSLDFYKDRCYVSLVGFLFTDTRLKGVAIPWHQEFEEINLRFYVTHTAKEGTLRRGTVFIKEIVPKPAISIVANTFYKEKYQTLPTKHQWETQTDFLKIAYYWKLKKDWYELSVKSAKAPQAMPEGSEEEFITEHYWGYTYLNDQKTSEYGVEHPRWEVYPVKEYTIKVDFGKLYGPDFEFLNRQAPVSVLLAEGSDIIVRQGEIIKL